MGEETTGGVIREYRGGAKLRRGADGRLLFCYNPCLDPETLKLSQGTIGRAIGEYLTLLPEPGDIHAMIKFAESRAELPVIQDLFRNLAEGGDDALSAFTFFRDAIEISDRNFSLSTLYRQFQAGLPVPSARTLEVEMNLRPLEEQMAREIGKAAEGKPFKPVAREKLEEIEQSIQNEIESRIGRRPTPGELDNYSQDMGYATRMRALQGDKTALEEIKRVGGGAEHVKDPRRSTENIHQRGRKRKREQEQRAIERLLGRR